MGARFGGTPIWNDFIRPGTILAPCGKALTSYGGIPTGMKNRGNLLIDQTIKLNESVDKLKNGIQINISRVVVWVSLGTDGGISKLGQSIDPNSSVYKGTSINVDNQGSQVTLKDLKTGNFILYNNSYEIDPSGTHKNNQMYVKLIDGKTLQFESVFANNSSPITYLNSTAIGASGVGGYSAWAVIDSITAY
ncbi:hypothetical protein [Lentilactobacillus sp. SPB1-3]|uniref:Uncharacterized protein n=1 Tax=Lentilactobacillus terminaliae TaxID=3003483 RepID=A0ACD5DCJ2_9LACO|nr:hypothetical protein [Lentilactobacillus sp. SPB1-3]MCZ0978106.1 hypothetical protein [Lentilactobacillus sp. SPB1-3]